MVTPTTKWFRRAPRPLLFSAGGVVLLAALRFGGDDAALAASAKGDVDVAATPSADAAGTRTGRATVGAAPTVTTARSAFGESGQLRMRFVRAGEPVVFPLDIRGEAIGYRYQWVSAGSASSGDVERPLLDASLVAPLKPGLYELMVTRGSEVSHIREPKLAVVVPFERKIGATLNGYRIGRYPAEWSERSDLDRPPGFLEIHPEDTATALSEHLRVADFLTHDRQATWPRYAAIDPRVVDKIELVLRELARRRGSAAMRFDVRVHSGFRTPLHNAGVEGAARDSRHLYGDAADVAIDADGDGRFTFVDAYKVERAVEWVERLHPGLAGGLGVYSSRRWPTPYVHIDARGERKRWRG